MGGFFPIAILLFLAVFPVPVVAADPVTITNEGWTISADGQQGVLSVSHDRLGTVIENFQLQLQDGHRVIPLRSWTAEKMGSGQLFLRTIQPHTAWSIQLISNALKISCASPNGFLIARVPAPPDRIPARVMDPRGTPVDWLGTDEVANGYGGSETRNQSYLPVQNPEIMTFALGQISSTNLHCLFDRKTDTVLSFSDQTRFERHPRDSNLLNAAIPVPGNTMIRLTPDYFTKVLGLPFYIPFDDSVFPRAPAVWCSWTSYYQQAREEDIVKNTDWLAARLKPYGFEYVQIDDGYDRGKTGEHYWIERWDRNIYPHGPEWLARYIKSKGLRPGLWLVPNAYAGAVEEHPDWYLRDKNGNIIRDYNTPALDSSNPTVLEFLKKLFATLRSWGFEYYKFDGEHALPRYIPSVDKERLHDKNTDPIVVYRNRLKIIRDAVGPQTFVEGCPAGTPLNGIGYFNSYFTGHDVYNSWQGMYPLFSSINANAFLNNMVIYVMPGEGIEVGPTMTVEEAKIKRVPRVVATAETRETPMRGFGVTLPEARTLTSWVSLTGVVYPVASVLPELPEERIRLLEMTLPTMPILPVDLFSRGTDMRWNRFKSTTPDDYIHNYPEILDLKVNAKSGSYDVVGLTNWRSWTSTREIDFTEMLGLHAGARYIAFDFWDQQLMGIFRDRMSIEVGPHDTRVILLHPLLNRPQLIGNSRHISGAYSILDMGWNARDRQLRGVSEGVPGKDYILSIYLPEKITVARVKASAKGGGEIAARQDLKGNLLKVSFQGQAEPVSWQVEFGPKAIQ
jgi:hypothetical protein